MKQNIFSVVLQKIENFPAWIKQALYIRLSEDIKSQVCEKFLRENADGIFSLYKPILTYKGSKEIENCESGLDLNLYNFLSYCKEDYTILDIALNTFLTVEEVSKYFIFCLEQGFVEHPEDINIEVMAGFLAGKFRTGEFFLKKGIINEEQLEKAIQKQSKSSKKIAEILVDMGFVSQEDVNAILSYKLDSQRRFILDYNEIPQGKEVFSDLTKKYESQIEELKAENEKLKNKISQLLEIVRNYE